MDEIMTDPGGALAEIDRLQREVWEMRAERNHLQRRAESLQHALDTTNAVYDDALDEIDQLQRIVDEAHSELDYLVPEPSGLDADIVERIRLIRR